MLAHFYIPGRSNDMKIAVQKSNFWSLILYRSLDSSKKRRQNEKNAPDAVNI